MITLDTTNNAVNWKDSLDADMKGVELFGVKQLEAQLADDKVSRILNPTRMFSSDMESKVIGFHKEGIYPRPNSDDFLVKFVESKTGRTFEVPLYMLRRLRVGSPENYTTWMEHCKEVGTYYPVFRLSKWDFDEEYGYRKLRLTNYDPVKVHKAVGKKLGLSKREVKLMLNGRAFNNEKTNPRKDELTSSRIDLIVAIYGQEYEQVVKDHHLVDDNGKRVPKDSVAKLGAGYFYVEVAESFSVSLSL